MKLSPEAVKFLQYQSESYLAQEHINHKTWYFDTGRTGPAYSELQSLGIIKPFGLATEMAWGFTEVGHELVMNNRKV